MERQQLRGFRLMRWVVALTGMTFILGGCDPTIQTTVENGIISASNSLFTAFLQAAVQVVTEAVSTTSA